MPKTFIGVQFPGKPDEYTYHDEWDMGLGVGDEVQVFARGRSTTVTVTSIDKLRPSFPTKQIDKVMTKKADLK